MHGAGQFLLDEIKIQEAEAEGRSDSGPGLGRFHPGSLPTAHQVEVAPSREGNRDVSPSEGGNRRRDGHVVSANGSYAPPDPDRSVYSPGGVQPA